MKKCYLLAALLMASTAAYAGNSVSFEIGGHRIHITAPRDCDSLSCLRISGAGLGKDKSDRPDDHDGDDVADRSDPPATKPAPPAQAAAPQAAAAGSATPTPAANSAPPDSAVVATITPAPAAANDMATPPPAAATVTTTAALPQPAAAAAPGEPPAVTPIGVWATEANKGNVRIEPCGQNLCGYAVKSGERILLNMKPSNTKWSGRIHDPDSGRDYDSTIAMKGPNALRVQGCAFGGLFCGGQTWKRVG